MHCCLGPLRRLVIHGTQSQSRKSREMRFSCGTSRKRSPRRGSSRGMVENWPNIGRDEKLAKMKHWRRRSQRRRGLGGLLLLDCGVGGCRRAGRSALHRLHPPPQDGGLQPAWLERQGGEEGLRGALGGGGEGGWTRGRGRGRGVSWELSALEPSGCPDSANLGKTRHISAHLGSSRLISPRAAPTRQGAASTFHAGDTCGASKVGRRYVGVGLGGGRTRTSHTDALHAGWAGGETCGSGGGGCACAGGALLTAGADLGQSRTISGHLTS